MGTRKTLETENCSGPDSMPSSELSHGNTIRYPFRYHSKTFYRDGLTYSGSVWKTPDGWTCGEDIVAGTAVAAIEFWQLYQCGIVRDWWWTVEQPSEPARVTP